MTGLGATVGLVLLHVNLNTTLVVEGFVLTNVKPIQRKREPVPQRSFIVHLLERY